MEFITKRILEWYKINKRDLPWRGESDPYKVWISEIILQQTRVAQGYEYYLRFIERFPNVNTLATAPLDDVLRLWQGLGYYTRARNIHKAANQIVNNFSGEFPRDYRNVISLSGVGAYTAAAICSLAFDKPHAVLDGNVYRVLSRIFAIKTPVDTTEGARIFNALADSLLDKKHPGEYNQAIMDFGALQCTPAAAKCDSCPLAEICQSYMQGNIYEYPVKLQKVKVKERYFNYILVRSGEYTFIKRREDKDIWRNLYEFPCLETVKSIDEHELIESDFFRNLFGKTEVEFMKISGIYKHVLTHRRIFARFYEVNIADVHYEITGFLKIKRSEIDRYAIPRLIEIYIEGQGI
ncbi:MAG: A/G-specific adenine glycosylase [Paludibacter sp.]|nr:A/G-specific adenine glycosylase [Paludibacter sp.]